MNTSWWIETPGRLSGDMARGRGVALDVCARWGDRNHNQSRLPKNGVTRPFFSS